MDQRYFHSRLSQQLGCESYQHGFARPEEMVRRWIPWAHVTNQQSPLDIACPRWPKWNRWRALRERWRYLPSLVQLAW
uniref:hypothetical protein n=1 Tax=Thaumasiovibrio occultus TaxID=1891184 RepID=UPI00131DE03F|nr:hypothetical protein [Thaumasiovibrio occultus]